MSSTMQMQHFVIIVCYFISNPLLFFRIFSVTLIQSHVVYIWRPKFSKTSCVLVQCSVTLHHLMERSNPRPQQNVWSPKLHHVKCRAAFLWCYSKPFFQSWSSGPGWHLWECPVMEQFPLLDSTQLKQSTASINPSKVTWHNPNPEVLSTTFPLVCASVLPNSNKFNLFNHKCS